jgi:hypothetical protein
MQKEQAIKHTQTDMLVKTRDEYLTTDRAIIVDTNKESRAVTIEVTLFNPLADRCFDRLVEEKRNEWVDEFFNGENAPMITDYKLVCHGH